MKNVTHLVVTALLFVALVAVAQAQPEVLHRAGHLHHALDRPVKDRRVGIREGDHVAFGQDVLPGGIRAVAGRPHVRTMWPQAGMGLRHRRPGIGDRGAPG